MITTTRILFDQLKDYANPQSKIKRMMDKGELIPIVRGLYETDRNVSPYLLSASICSPSYVSFESALSYYGMIPERVVNVTAASFRKHKTKMYKTPFGLYIFGDILDLAFPLGIRVRQEGEYYFRIACREKALCDELCHIQPMRNQKEIEICLYDDLRIYDDVIENLDVDFIARLSELYHSTNVRLLASYLKRVNR